MKLLKLSLGLLCASTLCLQAASLQREYVAANSGWFVHLDVDRFKETKLGQFVLEQLQQPDAQKKINDLKTAFNFDPTKALHGFTVYGEGNKPENGVLLVFGEFDTNRLLTLVQANKDYDFTRLHNHTIYSWIDENNSKHQRTYGAMAPGVVIFGQSSERIAGALDVIQGTQPSLKTSNPFGELGLTVKSPVLIGAARRVGLPDSPPLGAMLKHFEFVALGVGETNGQLQAELPVRSTNEKAAHQILAMDQGMVAMLSLQTDPIAQSIAQGLTATESGSNVLTTLKLPVADFVQIIKDAQAKKK